MTEDLWVEIKTGSSLSSFTVMTKTDSTKENLFILLSIKSTHSSIPAAVAEQFFPT